MQAGKWFGDLQCELDDIQFAAPRLRADRNIAMYAVRQSGGALRHLNDTLRADREIVEAAVNSSGMALQHAATELRSDRTLVLQAIQHNGAKPQLIHRRLEALLKVRELLLIGPPPHSLQSSWTNDSPTRP